MFAIHLLVVIAEIHIKFCFQGSPSYPWIGMVEHG